MRQRHELPVIRRERANDLRPERRRRGVTVVLAAAVLSWYGATCLRGNGVAAIDGSDRSSARRIPPRPTVSVQINGHDKALLPRGTPFIISVQLANQQAMNAAAWNRSNELASEALKAAARERRIPEETLRKKEAHFKERVDVRFVVLGDGAEDWTRFLRLEILPVGGKRRYLAWPHRMIARPPGQTVTLDDKGSVQVDYSVQPVAETEDPTEDYELIAVLEVPEDTKLPEDRWQGRVEAKPARLSLMRKPEDLPSGARETADRDLARYFMATGDWNQALRLAEGLVARNPKSVGGLILVGEAKEGLGDRQGALAAYQGALQEFLRQHPDPEEPPRYLTWKIKGLLEHSPSEAGDR